MNLIFCIVCIFFNLIGESLWADDSVVIRPSCERIVSSLFRAENLTAAVRSEDILTVYGKLIAILPDALIEKLHATQNPFEVDPLLATSEIRPILDGLLQMMEFINLESTDAERNEIISKLNQHIIGEFELRRIHGETSVKGQAMESVDAWDKALKDAEKNIKEKEKLLQSKSIISVNISKLYYLNAKNRTRFKTWMIVLAPGFGIPWLFAPNSWPYENKMYLGLLVTIVVFPFVYFLNLRGLLNLGAKSPYGRIIFSADREKLIRDLNVKVIGLRINNFQRSDIQSIRQTIEALKLFTDAAYSASNDLYVRGRSNLRRAVEYWIPSRRQNLKNYLDRQSNESDIIISKIHLKAIQDLRSRVVSIIKATEDPR
jgi:hypothetical protein